MRACVLVFRISRVKVALHLDVDCSFGARTSQIEGKFTARTWPFSV